MESSRDEVIETAAWFKQIFYSKSPVWVGGLLKKKSMQYYQEVSHCKIELCSLNDKDPRLNGLPFFSHCKIKESVKKKNCCAARIIQACFSTSQCKKKALLHASSKEKQETRFFLRVQFSRQSIHKDGTECSKLVTLERTRVSYSLQGLKFKRFINIYWMLLVIRLGLCTCLSQVYGLPFRLCKLH